MLIICSKQNKKEKSFYPPVKTKDFKPRITTNGVKTKSCHTVGTVAVAAWTTSRCRLVLKKRRPRKLSEVCLGIGWLFVEVDLQTLDGPPTLPGKTMRLGQRRQMRRR